MAASLWAAHPSAQRWTARPVDLQGFWTNGTATPLQRPKEFAAKPFLSEAEAAEFEQTGIARLTAVLKSLSEVDVTTAADLNDIYLETNTLKLVDGRRTSLIVDPPNGELPPLVPAAKTRAAAARRPSYDDPEERSLDERCLLATAFGSSNSAPPMVPNPFASNYYQIVQTPRYVMILTELVHDARIIRIGGSHLPANVHKWLGDSIGRWEGETLVVDTTNFNSHSRFRGATERLHVVERFRRENATTIQYRVTVEDPDTWTTPWTADIPLKATDKPILEYACHEANYSMENSLRGMRAQEREDAARKK